MRRAQLTDAIRTVMRDDILLAPSITRRLVEQCYRQAPASRRMANLAELTPREVEVLVMVARGLSNAEIASELVVAETTVKTHVARILMKLGARDRAQAVIAAYEAGLVHADDA